MSDTPEILNATFTPTVELLDTTPMVHTALAAVIRDLPGIGKDSTGKGLQYNYRGIEDIVPVVKRLFAQYGVHMTARHDIVTDADKQGNSGKQRRVVLQSTFRFYAVDGSFVDTTTIGEAMDVQDKAFNKAMTASYKYALIQTLAIADGDDPDAYLPEGPQAAHNAPQAPAPAPTAPDGHISVAEAKGEFLTACDGDKECASQAWSAFEATGVEITEDAGHRWIRASDVLAGVAQHCDTPADPAPAEEPAPTEPEAES